MANKDKTSIVVILDRSGSMSSIKDDMEGGFAQFVKEQKAQPGSCAMSLFQFDDQYDPVYENKPIAEVPALNLIPRGSTALLDAVGKTLGRTAETILSKPEDERPGAVIFMIITDGRENASKEYKKEQIRNLIKSYQEKHSWQFVYLGADANSFDDAQMLGVAAAARFSKSAQGVDQMYGATSRSVASYRNDVSKGVVGAAVNINPDLTTDESK